MTTLDYLTFLGYFVLFGAVAYWFSRGERTSADDYFLANRSLPWYVIGGSFAAADIAAHTLIGMVAASFLYGITIAMSEWATILVYSILVWLFIPFLLASRAFTIPEYLEQRFGIVLRQFFAVVTIIANIVAFLAAVLYAGGLALHHIFGWHLALSIVFIAITAGLWTLFGGLRSVVWSDFLKLVVMISGTLCVTYFGLKMLAGADGSLADGLRAVIERNRAASGVWRDAVEHALPNILPGHDSYDRLNVIQPAAHPIKPWTQLVFGLFHIGIWYNVLNQFTIQRVLAARDAYHARMGIVFAGYLKLLMPFINVLPGLILFALYPEILLLDWGTAQQQADEGYATLIKELVPAGVTGLVLAALFGALQSMVSYVLNSTSTIFTMDIYKRMLRCSAQGKELVRVGMISTVVILAIAISLAVMIDRLEGEVYLYLNTIYAFFAPPFAAVFLLGILWRRINTTGATTAVIVGFAFGIALKLYLGSAHALPWLNAPPHWLYSFANQAALNWVLCVAVCVGVSLLTPPQAQVNEAVVFNWKKLGMREGLGTRWFNHVALWWGIWALCVLATIIIFSDAVLGA